MLFLSTVTVILTNKFKVSLVRHGRQAEEGRTVGVQLVCIF